MSQRNVERILGRLVTDEAFRGRFAADPESVLAEQESVGLALNSCERRSLLALRREPLERFAAALDPCIQKAAAWSAPAMEDETGADPAPAGAALRRSDRI